uniref:Uncharacterized protein n=1 Tax=Tetraselmis sp. GSL018 TaxID=582737 RepID=A0A061QQB0_9CHLO
MCETGKLTGKPKRFAPDNP